MENNGITSREIQILDMISKGCSTLSIAQNLFISANTVKTHRKNMMIKLDARNSASMVRKGFELGLIKFNSSKRSKLEIWSKAS